MDSLLKIIVESSNKRLDTMIFQDVKYLNIEQKVSRKLKRLEKGKLSKKQKRAVDELLTANNEENARCCHLLYEQGLKDCASLFKELGII